MRKLALAAALLLGAAVVYRLAAPGSPAPSNSEAPGAPALSGPTLQGQTLSLSDFAGKVVLVDFWATWCDPCREELPDLVKLREKLKGGGFEILGVSMDEEAESVRKFTAKRPLSYPVILNGGERAPAGWTVPGLPTAYLVGRDGTVRQRWFGTKDMAEVEAAIHAALEK